MFRRPAILALVLGLFTVIPVAGVLVAQEIEPGEPNQGSVSSSTDSSIPTTADTRMWTYERQARNQPGTGTSPAPEPARHRDQYAPIS